MINKQSITDTQYYLDNIILNEDDYKKLDYEKIKKQKEDFYNDIVTRYSGRFASGYLHITEEAIKNDYID